MPSNDNAHAIRLYNALLALGGGGAAEELAQQHPLSKSADDLKKYQWALAVCRYLEEHYSEKPLRPFAPGATARTAPPWPTGCVAI